MDRVEELPFRLTDYVLSLSFVLFVRLLLEYYSSKTGFEFGTDGNYMGIHSVLWFLNLKLSLVIILHYLTKIPITKLLYLLCVLFPVVWLAPSLDLIFSEGAGSHMTYLHVNSGQEAIQVFSSFMQSTEGLKSATIGLTVEVAIILIGIAVLVGLKTGSWIRSILGLLLSYICIYLYAIYPFLFESFFSILGIPNNMAENVFARNSVYSLLAISLFLIPILFWIADKYKMKVLLKDIRPYRVAYYVSVFCFGLALLYPRFQAEFNSMLFCRSTDNAPC